MLISKRTHLGRLKAFDFLGELALTEGKTISLYLPKGTTQDRVENLLRKVLAATAIPPGVAEATAGSGTGAAFFWSPSQMYLV